MSYARFGTDSNVYVYATNKGYECCGCGAFNGLSQLFLTPQEIIDHLQMHQNAGDLVPGYTFAELGAEVEQERIIKLLTTKKESMIAANKNAREIWGIGTAIALILIKGENN